MSISGKILIDKLRISFPVLILSEAGHTINSYISKAKNILSNYFPERAYSVSYSRGEIKITLTPTRFKPPNIAVFTDTNIEMPDEEWLLNLLLELGFENRRLSEIARIVLIHLTKNIITINPATQYINFLYDYHLKGRYSSGFIYSDESNHTLRIATIRKNIEKSDTNGQFSIIFYDKIRELADKANLRHIDLKEPLTDSEKAELDALDIFYNKTFNRLDLYNLNLLRCELQYKYKEKIKPLAIFLNDNSNDTLTISTVIELLEKNTLYEKLNDFYIKKLKEVIFYKEPDIQVHQKLTSFQKAYIDLIKESDIQELMLIYKACGLSNKFSFNVKKFFANTTNPFYSELYNKLCIP